MTLFTRYRNLWRLPALLLLLLAFFGPWAYSADGAPPAAWCNPPYRILENGRCGQLLSGNYILAVVTHTLLAVAASLFSGATTWGGDVRELGFLIRFAALLLPFFTPLLLLRARPASRRQLLHPIFLLLALAPSITLLVTSDMTPVQLWGLWLYLGTLLVALVLELLLLIAARRPVLPGRPAAATNG